MPSGTVLGAGLDGVETRRMAEVLRRRGDDFKRWVFLPKNQAYGDSGPQPLQHQAGRLAVKEAATQALGAGIGSLLSWLDVEGVREGATGTPRVNLSSSAAALARRRGVRRLLVSLSRTRHDTVAQALLPGGDAKEDRTCAS